ncbi:protocadherin Fat 4-like isoform X4 [Oculina patagonica]
MMTGQVQTKQHRRPRPIKRRFNNRRWRWLARTPGRILKQLAMERRPAELRRIAAVIFLLINFGVIISESLVIDDPRSTVICIAGNTSHNVSFVKDITAGVFTSLNRVNSVRTCVRRACNRRDGDMTFLVGTSCFMVRCYSESSCKTKKSSTPSSFEVSITPYRWFDAAPVFTDLPKVLEVKENNQRGQIIKNIYGQARSRWSQNASIKYTIIKGNTGNAFELRSHPQGQSASLVATKRLDRETMSWYNLTILAKNTEENKTSTTVLSINVTDDNDNAPVFTLTNYSVTIFSNRSSGSEVFRVSATDADSGENARIRFYLLNHQSLFRMLPDSGTILLNQKLRVDRKRTYTLIVAARNGAHKTITFVTVRVLPVNEYRPFFENLQYRIKVSEAMKAGSSVIKVLAKDFDFGNNGELNFSLIAGNLSYFSIDNEGVVRTRMSLLTLGGKNCSLTVIVSDKGMPPKRAKHIAKVFIIVDAIRKHKVTFDLKEYHVTLAENTPVGSTILTVRAVTGSTKLDEIPQAERRLEKRSKRVVYSIGNPMGNLAFTISRHTGEIRTKVSLDYEKVKEYRLTLIAKDTEKKDDSGRAEIDTAEVKIHVLDLNDNAPRFVLDSYQKVISENATVDSEILRVTATDPDSGTNGQVHYSISNGNVNGTFELDNKDGVLKLQQRLTRPTVPNLFNLTIYATDHGTPSLTSKPVFVYLKIRRPVPKCSEKDKLVFPVAVYLTNVNESCPLNTPILRVRANIGKCGPRGRINYFLSEIRDPEVENHFVINSQTGVIRLIKPLDYEVRNRYAFYVGAVDIRNENTPDTVLVRILVDDENDNKPVFYKQRYKELISTLPEPGTEVAMVKAFDKDSGKNAELEYVLISGSGGFFRINPRTGAISTVKKLNTENLRLFNITMSVSDHGTPPHSSVRQAQASILVFTPLKSTLILIETTDTTVTVRFNLKYVALSNIAKYGIIVQEYVEGDSKFEEITEKEPLTWYKVNKESRENYRYITTVIQSNPTIGKSKLLEVKVGIEKNCDSKDKRGDEDYCNGPLSSGKQYRFQLRAYLKSTGPFEDVSFQDSDLSSAHFTALPPEPKAAYKKEGRKNYDAVVYSVGTALVLVIILAFLRGFYRLKLDRKRIHEEKKKRISFPMSNPRFQEPNSPVEKINHPGPAKKMVAVNHDKGSEFSHRDEDEGSSPDSALGHARLELLRKQYLSVFRTAGSPKVSVLQS